MDRWESYPPGSFIFATPRDVFLPQVRLSLSGRKWCILTGAAPLNFLLLRRGITYWQVGRHVSSSQLKEHMLFLYFPTCSFPPLVKKFFAFYIPSLPSELNMAACVPCGRSYSKKSSLKRHMAAHHSDPQHQCPECHNIYARRDVLERHLKQSHSETRRVLDLEAEATESEDEDEDQRDILEIKNTGILSGRVLPATLSPLERDPSETALSMTVLPDSWFATVRLF